MNELEFIEFFRAQLTEDFPELNLDTVFIEIPDWDSLTVLLLINNLNDDYSIDISIADLQNCKTLGDIHVLISSK